MTLRKTGLLGFLVFVLFVSLASCTDNAQPQKISSKVEIEKKDIAPPKWQYRESAKDAMRGTVHRYAKLMSLNTVDFSFPYHGGSQGYLQLGKEVPVEAESKTKPKARAKDKAGESFLIFGVTKGQILCRWCYIAVKCDDGPIEKYYARTPNDGSHNYIYFLSKEQKLIKKIRESQTIIIEVDFYKEGSRQFQFGVANLQWE